MNNNKIWYEIVDNGNYPINSGTNKEKLIKEAIEWAKYFLKYKPEMVKLPFKLNVIKREFIELINVK